MVVVSAPECHAAESISGATVHPGESFRWILLEFKLLVRVGHQSWERGVQRNLWRSPFVGKDRMETSALFAGQ